jgi:hypothetical protein
MNMRRLFMRQALNNKHSLFLEMTLKFEQQQQAIPGDDAPAHGEQVMPVSACDAAHVTDVMLRLLKEKR